MSEETLNMLSHHTLDHLRLLMHLNVYRLTVIQLLRHKLSDFVSHS